MPETKLISHPSSLANFLVEGLAKTLVVGSSFVGLGIIGWSEWVLDTIFSFSLLTISSSSSLILISFEGTSNSSFVGFSLLT